MSIVSAEQGVAWTGSPHCPEDTHEAVSLVKEGSVREPKDLVREKDRWS